MNPAEWAAVLDALAKAEAVEEHYVGRARRDPRGFALAQAAVRAARGAVTAAAPITPVLGQPGPPEWVPVAVAARLFGKPKRTMQRRAQRGVASGVGRKVGGRWELHLPSQG